MTQEKETNRQAEQGKAETEIPCAVCRDLIPLVQDGVASPESEALVKAHLQTCPECRTLWQAGGGQALINNALLWAVLAMLFLINAGYGGGFSTLPVLLDQHFGTKTVSTTRGLALGAWAFAGLSGNQLASFVVTHTPDQAHRYAALIPVLTGLFALALISISLVKYLGGRNGEGKRSIGA